MRRSLSHSGHALLLGLMLCASSALYALAISALVRGVLGPPGQLVSPTLPGSASDIPPTPRPVEARRVQRAFDGSARGESDAHSRACSGIAARIVTESDDPSWSLATLSGAGGRARLVRAGDSFEDHKVAFIGSTGGSAAPGVWLDRSQRRCRVALGAAAPSVPADAPPGPRATGLDVAPFALLAGARFGRTPAGLALGGVRPGSLLALIGFEEGDVITRVNGLDAKRPEAALLALGRLRNGGELAIELARKSSAVTLRYRVR